MHHSIHLKLRNDKQSFIYITCKYYINENLSNNTLNIAIKAKFSVIIMKWMVVCMQENITYKTYLQY